MEGSALCSTSEIVWFEHQFGMKHILEFAGLIGDTKAGLFFLADSNDVWLLPASTTDGHFLETDTFFIRSSLTDLLMCLVLFKDVS